MQKNILIASMGLALAATAFAETPDGQWRGLGGGSMAVTSGNTSTQSVLLNVDMARLTTQDKISLGGYVNEGKTKAADGTDVTTAGRWGAAGQYDYNLTPDMYGFGKLGFEHDRVINLSLRTLLGVGVGYHVIRTKADTFDVFGGVSENDSRYKVAQTIGNETKDHFTSTGLLLGEESSHQLNNAVFFKQRLEYYPGLTGQKAQLAKFSAGLSVAMSSTMSLTVGLLDTYNSKVADGMKKNDMSLFTGVNVKLGSL